MFRSRFPLKDSNWSCDWLGDVYNAMTKIIVIIIIIIILIILLLLLIIITIIITIIKD